MSDGKVEFPDIPSAEGIFLRRRMRAGSVAGLMAGVLVVCIPAKAGVFEGFRYTTEIASAAKADRVAWIDDQDGVTSLWTARGTEGPPLLVARSGRDDGQPIHNLALAASGRWIAYRAGSSSPTPGRTANPATLMPPPTASVWVAAPGSPPCKLTEGTGPLLPDHTDRLGYLRGGDLWIAELGGGCAKEEKSAHLALHLRTPISSFIWSPAGDAVAVTTPRGSYGVGGAYSLIGVYRLGGTHVEWVAPSFDRDVSPAWSPDGKRLAFLRLRSVSYEHTVEGSQDHPVPFQMEVVDLASGTLKTVWSSPGADSDSRQWNDPTTLPVRWLDNGRLVFTSEHEGWHHLYRLDLAGDTLTNLTPGSCEAEFADASADGAALYVSSNCRVSDQRSLFRIDTRNGTRTLLTPKDGVFTNPAAFVGGVAFRSASGHAPQTIEAWRESTGGIRALEAPLPGPDPASDVSVQTVHFPSTDGLQIEGQIFLSQQSQAHRRPAIVFVHGGPERQMLTDSHYMEFYGRYFWMNRRLAAHGYAVLSVNYRSGIGHGRAFRRAAGAGPFGAAEYGDVLAGAKFLQARTDVDPERIGIWGQSWGGYLTAMALARNSDVFKAGVDFAGVHDHAFGTHEVNSINHDFGVEQSQAELARDSAPIGNLALWRSPILIGSGDDDPEVPVEESIDLAARLRARGVSVETLLFPDEQHSFILNRSWDAVYSHAENFFDRHLANGGN